MFELLSVARDDLDICVEFFKTKKEAFDAMVKNVMFSSGFSSIDEIRANAEYGLCGLSEDEAWVEGENVGTISWKIVEIPKVVA